VRCVSCFRFNYPRRGAADCGQHREGCRVCYAGNLRIFCLSFEHLSFEISNGLREVPKGCVDLMHEGGEVGLVDIDVLSAPFTNELIVRFKPSERLRVLDPAAGTSDDESVAI
jgi:hypothetical protein